MGEVDHLQTDGLGEVVAGRLVGERGDEGIDAGCGEGLALGDLRGLARVGLRSGLGDLMIDGVLDGLLDFDLADLDPVGGLGEEDERREEAADAVALDEDAEEDGHGPDEDRD